jgi:hypothetical protein
MGLAFEERADGLIITVNVGLATYLSGTQFAIRSSIAPQVVRFLRYVIPQMDLYRLSLVMCSQTDLYAENLKRCKD